MLISIITINFNNKDGLKKTIDSVLLQENIDYEYIVIDGGSTDGSAAVIADYESDISYWVSEEDDGIYQAMNKGIRASKGKYLLFLNSGDILNNKGVLVEVEKELFDDLDIYYGDLMIERNGELHKEEYPDTLSFSYFYHRGYVPHPATFTKRDLFDRVYYFNEDFKIVSDWDFLVCAICKHNASYRHLDITVTNYDTTGISSNSELRPLLLEEKMKSLKANFPLFIEDANQLITLRQLFESNRFKLLTRLENKKITQRINSVWLRALSNFFNV